VNCSTFRNAVLALAAISLLFTMLAPLQVSAQEAKNETWTFMVYMSGDSSLSTQISSDIQEMKKVGSEDGLNIIVLSDAAGVGDSGLMRVLTNSIEDIALTNINSAWGPELNLGDPDVLSRFVIWATDEYPADRYMLDLWGHGNGWPGVCPDKGDYLDANDIETAMSDIDDAKIRLDIVSMDACQMGMLEIAYELRGKAGYALLSQKDVPLNGWPYDLFLPHLKSGGTPEEIGTAMIDTYITWGMGGNSLYSLTLSLIDLGKIEALTGALDDYSVAAEKMTGYFNPEFIAARADTEKYDGNAQYDLVHLLRNIDRSTECMALKSLSAKVLDAMDSCIVHENSWTNVLDEPAEYTNGMSIWFPDHVPSVSYMETHFAQDTAWPDFLYSLAGYFQEPGRVEVPHAITVASEDSDADGLADAIMISQEASSEGTATVEIYGPDGNLFSEQDMGQETGTIHIQLDALGYYGAATYLRDVNGTLLNYTLKTGLAKEGMSIISGRVTSNTGRGLAWVGVSLLDSLGNTVAMVFTDNSGFYDMEVVIPRDTNGTGLILVCGLGTGQQNATIGTLGSLETIDFSMDISSAYIPWVVRVIGALNLVAFLALVYWVAWGREKRLRKASETVNVIDRQTIPPS